MTTIAELGIAINSESASQAADDLDRLTAAGAKTEQAAAKMGASWDDAQKKMGRSTKSYTDTLSEQEDALEKLLGQIDPTVAAYGRLDDMQHRLFQFRGTLGEEAFAEYSSKIDASRTALGRFDDGLNRSGMTAKQTAANLRMLPAQFTDIVVSLQGGQAPLTVLLQQGGQLKDMFGGIGPAARAMAGYIAGLVNPFTIAAAAAGTLALAYYQGSQEQDEFRLSLERTGNAAGTTVTELANMADHVSATVGTTGKAADVLAQLAGTGKITADSLEDLATAAIAWEKAGGQAASETVAEFAKLGDEPVKAVLVLNEKYNFLTASVFEQIRALEEEGDTVGASRLAWGELSDTLNERAERITQNLGAIESAWQGITGAAKGAWDAMLDVGRSSTLDDQISFIDTRLKQIADGGGVGLFQDEKTIINQLREQRDMLVSQKEAEADIAAYEGERARVQREGAKAYQSIQTSLESTGSKQEKLQKALLDNEREINKARAAGYKISVEEEAKLQQHLRDKFKERTRATPAVREDAGLARVATIGRENAALEQQLQTTTKLTAGEKELAKFAQEVAELKERKILTAQQKQVLASESEIRAELNKRVELEKQVRLREEAIKLSTYQATLNSQLEQAQAGNDLALAGLGMGDAARQRMQEGLRIQQEYAQQQRRLQSQLNQGQISSDLFTKENAALDAALKERLRMQEDYYKAVDNAQSDWSIGAQAAFGNYLEEARNVAGQTQSLFTNAFGSMEDAIVSFATTGKLSFSDFAKSILADMARIATRQASSQILGALFGAASSYIGGGASAASTSSSLGASSAGYSSSYFPQALGGAWENGVQLFANGGAFTNSIVSKPTAFGTANGQMGVMGEAGEEAIMPLTRTSSGALGVRAVGGSGEGGNTYNFPISVSVSTQTDGSEDQGGTNSQEAGKAIQAAARTEAETAINKGLQPGGRIWLAMNGR